MDCPENCRGCLIFDQFSLEQPYCYECNEGFTLNDQEEGCVIGDWNNANSAIRIHADQYSINRCDKITMSLKMEKGGKLPRMSKVSWEV